LQGKWLGPYEVVTQYKNDVTCLDLVSDAVLKKPFYLGDLKLFDGTKEQAYQQALLDQDQFVIDRFITYRGDPELRQSVEFEVKFVAGAIRWLTWTRDLFVTIPYEDFCRSKTCLMPLLYDVKEATRRISALKRQPITAVGPGIVIYLNLRYYSHTWYKSLDLPDIFHKDYVVRCTYGDYVTPTRKKIHLIDTVFNNDFQVDNFFVFSWGSTLEFLPESMVLVTKQFVRVNPCLKAS